jgi:hypothetical protein
MPATRKAFRLVRQRPIGIGHGILDHRTQPARRQQTMLCADTGADVIKDTTGCTRGTGSWTQEEAAGVLVND